MATCDKHNGPCPPELPPRPMGTAEEHEPRQYVPQQDRRPTTREERFDALLIAAVEMNEALGATIEKYGEQPLPVIVALSHLWGALQDLGAVKGRGKWSAERERQRQIGRDEERERWTEVQGG